MKFEGNTSFDGENLSSGSKAINYFEVENVECDHLNT